MLSARPIRSSQHVIIHNNRYYSPLLSLTQNTTKKDGIIVKNDAKQVVYVVKNGKATVTESGKQVSCKWQDNTLVINEGGEDSLELPHQQYSLYENNPLEKSLLTNSTLLSLKNPWILEDKYRSVLPLKNSTPERCYLVPSEMKLTELLKYIQICGFTIHKDDISKVTLVNQLTGNTLPQDLTVGAALQQQEHPFLRLEA